MAPIFEFAYQPMLADSSELMVYILPTLGSMLLFYGVFQAISESRAGTRRFRIA